MRENTHFRIEMPAPAVALAALLAVFGTAATTVHAQEAARRAGPPVIFAAALPDVAGRNLEVVELNYAPNASAPSTAASHGPGHHHPGSVLVYVVEGSVRLAIEGEPVQVVRAGETFFEPPGAHHVINENASATEPAKAIAFMIVPEGEPNTSR